MKNIFENIFDEHSLKYYDETVLIKMTEVILKIL
jgi:hypothetical protein